MKTSLLTMATSKKFIATSIAILVYLAGTFLGADKATIDHIYEGILLYVGALGIADAGKSAAQIKAVAESAGAASIDRASAVSAMSRVASQVGILIVVICAASVVAIEAGCTKASAGRATTAGITTGLDCEAAHFDEKVFSDARVFADAKVDQWLAGGARPSSGQILADLAPFRSDLMRCALAGAVAAAISLGTAPQPPAGASSLATSSRTAGTLRESFSEAKDKLGWGSIRLTGGTVI